MNHTFYSKWPTQDQPIVEDVDVEDVDLEEDVEEIEDAEETAEDVVAVEVPALASVIRKREAAGSQ